ncbi:MAG TPA: hypothetical protein PLT04_04450 [Candidatus Saccharibacteria bacterium]|nr:hypothetical protein [Candidatus Saccharibacteria bacterium]
MTTKKQSPGPTPGLADIITWAISMAVGALLWLVVSGRMLKPARVADRHR